MNVSSVKELLKRLKGENMKTKRNNLKVVLVLVTLSIFGLSRSTMAQGPNQKPTDNVKTDSRILYHDGSVMVGDQDVYLIWYGCWDDTCRNGNTTTQAILIDFISSLGGSPYFQINAMYENSVGQRPTGALFYGGSVFDRFSHGFELTASDLEGIVADQIASYNLPQDPLGIYVVLASSEVSSQSTGFCMPSTFAHHGTGSTLGAEFKYAFVGNANRCPSLAASQFMSGGVQLPTPNDNLAADAMASTLAQVLSVVVTNPTGRAWFDRYGLESAAKCAGQFGPTYLTVNGARANLRLGSRDYLIQQNWVRTRKEHCAMNSSL
jgi:hypothetical protein